MPLFSRPLPIAKLGLLIAVSLSVLGARFLWVRPAGAIWFQSNLGYYFVLALVAVWLIFFMSAAMARSWLTRAFSKDHRTALWVVLGLTFFMHLHEPHVMRVLFDEPSHAVAALVMHVDKAALLPTQSNYVGDQFILTGHYTSFRQYLFPLLVSLLHDLAGYRVANVFVLNFLLTPVILLSSYFVGVTLGGKFAGLTAVGLLGTLPLLAQNVTSGGYDALNVALISVLLLCTLAYVRSTDADSPRLMNLSLATALLLAVARSESILYLLPWGLVTVGLWWRHRHVEVTAFAVIAPLFLLPNLMCNLIMMNNERALYSSLRKDGGAFFDVGYLPQHVAEAVFYFFNFSRSSTTSVLLSALGVLGSVVLFARIIMAFRSRRLEVAEGIVALFGTSVLLTYLVILTQFWSSPIDGLATRFSLSLMFIWAVLGGWLLAQMPMLRERRRWVYGAVIFWGIAVTAPVTSRAFVTHSLVTGRAEEWFLDYAEGKDRMITLFVENRNATFMAHRFASSRLDYLRNAPSVFVRAMRAGLYREIIVFQTFESDLDGGQWKLREGQELPENFVLETLDERIITPIYKARICRFVGYKKADGTLVTPGSDDPDISLRDRFASQADWNAYRLSLYP